MTAAAAPFGTVEFFQVQRRVMARACKGHAPSEKWVDVPDLARAVELEAFDAAEALAAEWPATRYRVVRRFKGRA